MSKRYVIIGNGTAAAGCIEGIRSVDKETPIDVTFVATEEGILTASVTCMDQHKEYTLENDLKMTLEEIEKSQSIMERVVTGC